MRRLCFGLMVVFTCFGARAASATTFQRFIMHGGSCYSITSGLSANVTQFGVNAGSTALNVVCPLLLPAQNYVSMTLEVEGYNRSSSDHVSCSIFGTDTSGNQLVGGAATLSSNMQAVQIQTVTISTPASPMPLVSCHLPAQTASGFSHVTNLFLTMGF